MGLRYMGKEPKTDERYLGTPTLNGYHAVHDLRDQGYEAVFARANVPRALAQGAVQEDASHLLLNEYDTDDIADVVDELSEYGADDVTLMAPDENGTYYTVPTDWDDIYGVGEQTTEVLADTGMEPWDIDEQLLNRELVKAYGVSTKNSMTTRIRNANPRLFDDMDVSAPDQDWPDIRS